MDMHVCLKATSLKNAARLSNGKLFLAKNTNFSFIKRKNLGQKK